MAPTRPARLPRLFAGKRRALLARLVANGVAQAALLFALARLLRRLLDSVRAGALDEQALGAMAGAGIGLLALRVGEAGDAERLGQDYVMRVRLRILSRVAARPTGARADPRLGLTMTRMISDLNGLRNWVSVGVARALVAAITLVGLGAALAGVDGRVAALAAGLVGGCTVVGALVSPLLQRRIREARRKRGHLANNVGEKLLALRTVAHFGRTRRELGRVRRQSRRLSDALVRRARVSQLLRSLPRAAEPIAIGLAVALAAGAGATDALVVQVVLIGLVAAALGEIARAWDYRLSFEEGRRRIGNLLAGPRLREPRDPVEVPGAAPVRLTLEGVHAHGLAGKHHAEAGAGDVVLVTGPSGSGKSTLLALAMRLMDPDEGEIRIDGIPVRRIALDSLREIAQLVSPQVPLLRGTVADNVTYGCPDVDPGWLDVVVEACGLSNEPALPDGLETLVDERGGNLPDGLRARIALARACAVRPRLLGVDDPAFVVDPGARAALRRVQALLASTTLVVAPDHDPPLEPACVWRLSDASGEGGEIAAADARAK